MSDQIPEPELETGALGVGRGAGGRAAAQHGVHARSFRITGTLSTLSHVSRKVSETRKDGPFGAARGSAFAIAYLK